MKAITLHQPWASLVAQDIKTIESRSWTTSYRGLLVIHASKRQPDVEMLEDGPAGELFDESNPDDPVNHPALKDGACNAARRFQAPLR